MNYGFMKSVKARWRRPRGIDNKQRIRKRSAGPVPRVGYRNAVSLRFLHPSGLKEVLVHNMNELLAAGTNVVIRVAGGVGAKKRAVLEVKATEMKLRVLNPLVKKAAPVTAKPKAEPKKAAVKPKTAKSPIASRDQKVEATSPTV